MKCKNSGCNNNSGYNPKTGVPNNYCRRCYNNFKGKNNNRNSLTKEIHRKPTVFVLRGNVLTLNLTGKTKMIRVDRHCRGVKYVANPPIVGSDGKYYGYVIDIKRGYDLITTVLVDNKPEWDREFRNLQALLERL